MDAGSLLTASLKRDQAAIRTGAAHRGLAPDLLWLVAELAVSPFVYALQRLALRRLPTNRRCSAALDAWSHGYCPLCGSWPALAEVVATHRVLRCSFCALAWELTPTRACTAGQAARTSSPPRRMTSGKDRRVEFCSSAAPI